MLGLLQVCRDELRVRELDRYRAFYCGLCHAIGKRCPAGRLALSFEMTFLSILLTSLEEPETEEQRRRCLLRPVQRHRALSNEAIEYCADLSVMTAYLDLLDGWQDERRVDRLGESAVLKGAARKAGDRQPGKWQALTTYVNDLHALEASGDTNLDAAANLTGVMMAELFDWKSGPFSKDMQTLGFALGKTVYLMDAFLDLEDDLKKKQYNPLLSRREQPDFNEQMRTWLDAILSEGVTAFERLPLLEDAELLRNILYAGLWQPFERKVREREERGNQ